MQTLKTFAALAFAALLTACAATGPKMAEISAAIPAVKTGEARVYVYRNSSLVGAAMQPDVLVNGRVAGSSKPGGFFFVDVKPGPVEISTSTEIEKKLTFTAEAGQARYVRTVIGLGLVVGRVYPELVDNAEGAKEIADTSYIGAPLAAR